MSQTVSFPTGGENQPVKTDTGSTPVSLIIRCIADLFKCDIVNKICRFFYCGKRCTEKESVALSGVKQKPYVARLVV